MKKFLLPLAIFLCLLTSCNQEDKTEMRTKTITKFKLKAEGDGGVIDGGGTGHDLTSKEDLEFELDEAIKLLNSSKDTTLLECSKILEFTISI
ncbi:MAG: hypothetical protein HN509_14960 [Halobacteriovoraceae bacterium]|jgi:hypothetical protein|nr:hypothetical protein [Halobacteriovoraceae bacterium]